MNVVVVANDGDGDDGFVGERLVELGATLDRRWRETPGSLEGAELGSDFIVLLGSDWSVYQSDVADAVASEVALIRRAINRGVPLLGICFGGQITAAALGCEVVKAAQPEIGWRTLASEQARFSDGPWFQYHGDRWVDSGPVRSFMHNSIGPQAFEFGKVLALQFHPEVTESTASRWLRAAPGEVEAAGERVDEIEAETSRLIAGARARCRTLVDYFVNVVASREQDELKLSS